MPQTPKGKFKIINETNIRRENHWKHQEKENSESCEHNHRKNKQDKLTCIK